MDAHKVLPITLLVSDEVESEDGRKLGTIEEVMIDVEDGRIAYAVVSVGGLFGFRRKLRAVPWSAFKPSDHGALHLSPQVLEGAPLVRPDASAAMPGIERGSAETGRGVGSE